MNHHEIRDMNMADFSHLLRDKDINFRESWKQKNYESRHNEHDRRSPSTSRSSPRSSLKSLESSRSQRGGWRDGKRSQPRGDAKLRTKAARLEAKRKLDKDFPVLPKLPKEKHVKDDNGKTVERPCRFCHKMHMDYNCDKRPKSYYLILYDAWNVSDDEHNSSDKAASSQLESEGDNESVGSKDSHTHDSYNWSSYHNVYTSTVHEDVSLGTTLIRIDKYRIRELPMGFAMGTGVSYMSVEPAPIKAYISCVLTPSAKLTKGVVDSGGPSIIQKDTIPEGTQIMKSPSHLIFGGIGAHKTNTLGYVMLPVCFPNKAAMSGDGGSKGSQMVKALIEFQVVEHCPANYLIGIDAIKSYKMVIDSARGHVAFDSLSPPVRIPILDGNRYEKMKYDP